MTKNKIINEIENYIKTNQLEVVKEFFSNNTILYLNSKQSNKFDNYLKSLGFEIGVQNQIINYKLDSEFINRTYSITHGKIIFEFINF